MKKLSFGLLIYVAIVIAMLVGQTMCIYKAVKCNWEPIGKAEIIYTVSSFTGAGVVVGYFDIEDK